MNAIDLIAAERERQVSVEGWTVEWDDGHAAGDLSRGAAAYCVPKFASFLWPWEFDQFKPTPDDRLRELVKAGALIVAEIDRLRRNEGGEAS